MDYREQQRLQDEIKKMRPEPEEFESDDAYEIYRDMLRTEAHRFYNAVANSRDWTLVEFLDPETLTPKWFWRRKS